MGGMPEGSWLGPLTFIIIIVKLKLSCLSHKCIYGTTVTKIFLPGQTSHMEGYMNKHWWSLVNYMQINNRKRRKWSSLRHLLHLSQSYEYWPGWNFQTDRHYSLWWHELEPTHWLYNTQNKVNRTFTQTTQISGSFSARYVTFLRWRNSPSLRVCCCSLAYWSNCSPLWSTRNNIKASTPYHIWWFKFHPSIVWIVLF